MCNLLFMVALSLVFGVQSNEQKELNIYCRWTGRLTSHCIVQSNHDYWLESCIHTFFPEVNQRILYSKDKRSDKDLDSLSRTCQFKSSVNIFLRKVMIDHIKETNGFTGIKYLLSYLLGIGLVFRKVNNRDRFNSHLNVCMCVCEKKKRERKADINYKLLYRMIVKYRFMYSSAPGDYE
jgi:hypothetical protein